MRKILTVFMFIVIILTAGCTKDSKNDEHVYPKDKDYVASRDRYDNKFDEVRLPGQWEGYGVGDPYILRYNGEYYLYASTKNFEIGVRAWKSTDLINWSRVNNSELELGYVSDDPVTKTAYAPEVIYWNGTFYMYTSPGGNGHYVLTSESPEGPFIKATDNFGEKIDGSVFIDDDETMYFLRAHNTGIRLVSMEDPLTVSTGKTLDNSSVGVWTEGPCMIKRDGIYYLTYTGTSVISPGYRVNYSTTDTISERTSYVQGAGNSLLLSTNEEWKGLGHSSTVLGPDMDSYYITYHNLNNAAGPNRSFNLSRLIFNGTMMSVVGPTLTNNQVPALPEFYSYSYNTSDYTVSDGFKLSNKETSKVFTSEFNFKGKNTKLIFNYKDKNEYSYVSIDTNKILLNNVTNGNTEVISEGNLKTNFDFTKLHSVRVAVRDNKVDVYFDNLKKIENAVIEVDGGNIGYVDEAEIFYTAFSNVAKGLSDSLEAKKGYVGANTYLEDHSSFSSLTKIEANTEVIDNGNIGSYEIKLSKKDEYASYLVDVDEKGFYGLYMYLKPEYESKQIGIQIDDATPFIVTIPEMNSSTSYVNQLITEFDLPSGIHRIKFINVSNEFGFNYFSFEKASKVTPDFENDLSNYVTKGVEYVTKWKLKDGGHYGIAGTKQVVYFGDETVKDCTIEVDMKFVGETSSNTAGILLRASNIAFSNYENYDSLNGYYIGLNNNRVFLNKYNYSLSEYNLGIDTNTRPNSNEFYHVKVNITGNLITVLVNDNELFSYYDTNIIQSGRIGFYTEGAAVIYKNLKISK